MKSEKLQFKAWRKVKLGEVLLEVDSGGRPVGGTLTVFHGVPSIGAEHLNDNGGFDFSKIKYVPEKYYEKSSRGKVKFNDVLCVKDGATIGKVSRITKNFPFLGAMVNEHVFIVRSKPNLLDQPFLFYKLRTREGRETIKNSIGGSAQGGLKKDFLDHWEIDLPSLPEQKRIADILSAFDGKIEMNNKISRTLEQMASAIFKEWFVKFNFPVEFEVKSEKLKVKSLGYKEAGGKMVDSELGKIPEGWEVKNFEDIMDFLNGEYIPQSEYDSKGEYLIYGSNTIMGISNKYLYKGPIIILAKIGSYCGAIRYSHLPCWINNNAGGIRGKKEVPTSFIYYLLRRFNFNQVKEGTGQPFISMRGLKIQKAILPPPKLLDLFNKNIDSIKNYIANNEKENQKLTALRDLLLPKLMSGEVRI